MNEIELLTSVAMLETLWKTRQKDIVDLITPFIEYAVAKFTPINGIVDIQKTLMYVREKYGYTDLPDSIITLVLKRNKDYFELSNRKFKLIKALDDVSSSMETRHSECEKNIEAVGESLANYLNEHCVKIKPFTKESAITALHLFFKQYGLYIGIEALAANEPEKSYKYQTNYYIAQFILENQRNHTSIYSSIIDLTKGYFLRTAIYLQPTNGNLNASHYSNLEFYYDTPFLLSLLGYQSDEQKRSAEELHSKLKALGGTFYVFRQNVEEIITILNAYKTSLKNPRSISSLTLEGLDQKKYAVSDVERLIIRIDDNIQSSCECTIVGLPSYSLLPDGTIDQDKVLSEDEIKQYIRENTKHYKENNLNVDVDSAYAIHRLRDDIQLSEIEKAKAVFVTTNTDLARSFNNYYRLYVSSKAFPLLITAYDLSALTWVKAGIISDLPETQLLTNAYEALQPTPEMIEQFKVLINMMESENKITYEEAAIIRTERYYQNAAWVATFGEDQGLTPELIISLKEQQKELYLSDYKKEQQQKTTDERNSRIARAKEKAKKKAFTKKENLNRLFTIILYVFEAFLIGMSIHYIILSAQGNSISSACVVFTVLSIIQFVDIVIAKGVLVKRLFLKLANQYETWLYERYKKEYIDLSE